MKTKLKLIAICFLASIFCLPCFAQDTAFTYEGQIQDNGNPANGTYNLTFTLFDTNITGVAIAGPVTNNGVIIANGLFAVQVDFGPGVFTGAANWLQIGVETNGASPFTTLAPRQQIMPVPYAIYAENAGSVSASQLTSIGNTNAGASGNFFIGGSGNPAASGSDNTANGGVALTSNTSGSDNTANGFYTLANNKGGSGNTADGALALLDNISGSNNIALGFAAGDQVTTGSFNIDIGNQGLLTDSNIIRIGSVQSQTFIAGVINGNGGGLTNLNVSQLTSFGSVNDNFFVGPSGNATVSGEFNTGNGFQALLNIKDGSANTANGYQALLGNTGGSGNTANGFQTLLGNTSGSVNTADGTAALFNNTSGSQNTASGTSALFNNTSGSFNIALGYEAGYSISTGNSNIDIGNIGFGTDTNIIRIGSGQSQTFIAGVINGNGGGLTNVNASASQLAGTSDNNFIIGGGSTSGFYNTAVGSLALKDKTGGSFNTAIGASALAADTEGAENTAIGSLALPFNTGSYNIALGFEAGNNLNGNESSNIDIGNFGMAGENNTIRIGDPNVQTNTFIAGVINGNGGKLTNLNASQLTSIGNTNGSFGNFFIGPSGNSTMSGYQNTAYGAGALSDNVSGGGNTAVGYLALPYLSGGSGNIALGFYAGYNFVGNESGNIDIGNEGVTGDNNIIRIGASQTATYLAGTVNASGTVTAPAVNVNGTVTASNPSGPALTVGSGEIHVTGAGQNTSTAAFVQVTTAGNIENNWTFIDNPQCNGDPNAILIVTHNIQNIDTTPIGDWNHPIGVFYKLGQWGILNEDGATMPVGLPFNVLIVKN